MSKNNFNYVFLKAETKSLAGKQLFKQVKLLQVFRLNILKLFGIIFLSFLAIGFGEGATQYLKRKMDNPFINWLPLLIPYSETQEKIDSLKSTLNDKSIQNHFLFKSPEKYKFFTISLMDKNFKCISIDGRVVNAHSDLYNHIISKEKNLKTPKNNLFTEESWGVIVSEEISEKLSTENGYVNIALPYSNADSFTSVPIPVCAIVKDLPDFVDIIVNEKFLKQKESGAPAFYDTSSVINELHHKYLRYFINDETKYTFYKSKLNEMCPTCIVDQQDTKTENYVSGKILKILGTNEKTNEINKKIENLIKGYKPKRIFDFEKARKYDNISDINLDYFSIPFRNKDSIRPFENYLKQKYGLKIDMRTIESAENFDFVSKFSFLISIALIVFSIISIVLFIVNLILSHIEKIKKNIGTFKAFGLSNETLIRSYTKIACKFILIATFIAYVLAYLIGEILIKLILWLNGIKLESGYGYFDLFTLNGLIAFIAIIFIPTSLIYFIIKLKLKNTTPGNLIYERD